MWRYTTNVLLITLSVAIALADTTCTVSVESKKITSWSTGTETHSLWNVLVTATAADVTSLELHFPSYLNITDIKQITVSGPGYFKVPTDTLSYGGSHTFGYIVQGLKASEFFISNIACAPALASSTQRTPTVRTTSPATYDKVCDVVLVLDNFIVRSNPDLDAIRLKYTSYFTDVDLFYQKHFNMKMNLVHMHLENEPTFSSTNDEGELLDSFRSALVGGFFGSDIPTSVCTYHLVTGRDPVGIGGLSWIDTSCDSDYYNTGFSVDMNSQDEPVDVLRRMIHELGHGFGGQHFDYYETNPLYTCDAGTSNANNRVLKRSVSDPAYTYLTDDLFFSQCATNTIKSSLPAFPCLWQPTSATNLPFVRLYENSNLSGANTIISARNDIAPTTCYNIAYPYGSLTSSYLLRGASGIRFFESQDCIGQAFEFHSTSAYVGAEAEYRANSFQFLP